MMSIRTLVFGAAGFAVAASAAAFSVKDKEIVGVYAFDKDEKAAASDLSAAKNHGEILGNVKWTPDGKHGGALVFEGNTSWVSIPDHPSIQFPKGTDFTVAAWLKTEMSAGDPPMIVAKNYQPAGMNPWWALYYANAAKALDGSASFFLRDSGGVSHHIAGGPKVNDGKWHHLCGTRNGATIRFYVDGELAAEKGDADFDVGTNAGPMHFMSHLNRWMIGSLDEVFVIKKALSANEIKALMSGFEGFLAVEPIGKAAVSWGDLKR